MIDADKRAIQWIVLWEKQTEINQQTELKTRLIEEVASVPPLIRYWEIERCGS